MTTLVSNPSSSGRNKSTKDKKLHPNKVHSSSNVAVPSNNASGNNATAVDSSTTNNQAIEEFRNKNDKFQPTAEQMRIASLMSDKKDDDLKPKIEKIVELTGASREDAAVALYDCDNDMPKAIEMILDGESFDSEWQSTGRKKKTKAQTNQISDVALTNGGNKPVSEKSNRSNKNNISLVTQNSSSSKGQRGPVTTGKNRKKDFRGNNNNEMTKSSNDTEESDVFNSNNTDSSHRKAGNLGSKRSGASRGRGATRGRGVARGTRTFMNRGMQGNNSNQNDCFPNSIETWTNNAVEPSKLANDDLNTMTVGNWSDVAANEDWSEDDWTSAPMETKVFTPSTKVIPEKDESLIKDSSSKSLNHNSNDSQVYNLSSLNKTQEDQNNQHPTMSAIISNNIKPRPSPTSAGQALLQQIQQQQSQNVTQNSNLNQYTLSQYSKQATESIKSLVGMTSNSMIPNEHSLENLSKTSQQPSTNQSRIKVQNTMPQSKIPESAVEMPSSDTISNLTVHFGSLEFGSSSFPIGSNDSSLFDSVNQNSAKKQENKTMPLLSTNASASDPNYRTSNSSANASKIGLQGQVLTHSLNDSLLNNDHRNDKSLNASSYNSNKAVLERKNDYISQMSYKSAYPTTGNENGYSSSGYQASISANVNYYSTNANQVPFGNTNAALPNQQTLMANTNAYNNSSYNTTPKVIRDMENNNSVQTPQSVSSSAASGNKSSYDASSNVGVGTGSLSLMSSSTSTTNAIKNTLSSSKGIHNVPPGVTNSVQPTQVLSTPYIMSNTGLPIPYYPYDLQFSTTARDHTTYSPYAAAADVKYNRNSESDMLPVSSQAANVVQTATQAHNHYMTNYPPGYGFYFGFAQGLYGATQPALYPVPQAQNQASANSAAAFAKPSTAANYGSHSYNSGYDSIGTAAAVAAQTQDYVTNKPYQQHKQIAGASAAGDISTNQNMYSKTHPQLNKSYDKQGFQAQTPQMNLTNPAQAASAVANLSSAYNSAYALLPQQPTMHHSFTNATADAVTQQVSGTSGNQRTLSQAHKQINSNAGVATYGKFNWN